MTVIQPNSVAGINSITVQSGNSLAIHKSNGELLRTITGTTGVSTFSSISVGTAYTDNSAAKSINIGVGASISQHDANTLSLGTGGDERARIHSDGTLSLGTNSSASAKFNISHGNEFGLYTSGPYNFQAKFESTDAEAAIVIEDSNSGTDYNRIGVITNDMTFITNNNERLRIASNGDVGIGKNNPDVTLHVGGGAVTSPQIKLHRTSTYDNAWRFFQSHYDGASYGTLFIQPTLATTPNVEITNAAGDMAMRVDSDTGVISVKSGGGIDFSATANSSGSMGSELLDDYEEGVFTPTLTGGTTANNMHYTKIGRVVHISGSLAFTSISGSGNMVIGGLPYTSISTLDSYTTLSAHAYDSLNVGNNTYQFQTLRVDQNTTNMRIIIPAGNGNVRTFAQYSHVSGSEFRFRVAGFYITS